MVPGVGTNSCVLMKTHRLFINCAVTVLLAVALPQAFAQGTAFLYQGRINDGANPANGSYDMTFSLYPLASGGSQVGPSLTNLATPVTNGVFSLSLDFGNVYTGGPLYLQVGARTNGSSTFTNLPRQAIESTPYAVYANTAASLAGTLPVSALPNIVVTNNASGVTLTGAFVGDGTGLTVPSYVVTNNGSNYVLAGAFAGNGNQLTNLNASQLTNAIPTNVLPGFQAPGFSWVGGGQSNNCIGTLSAVASGQANTNSGNQTFLGGGSGNTIQTGAYYTFLGSGGGNTIQTNANTTVLAGGYQNTIESNAVGSVLVGGQVNYILTNAHHSFLGAGFGNTNSGPYAMIPGGQANIAASNSFAAGISAQAIHADSFVWSDGSAATPTIANNSVTMRASNGFRLFTGSGTAGAQLAANATAWTVLSDRNAKKNFKPVDGVAILKKLSALPVEQWNYKWERDDDVPNIGPMAQDFKAAFFPGRDDKGITTLEFDGVELAAIKALNEKLEAAQKTIQEKDASLSALEKRIEALEQAVHNNSNSSH